MGPIIVLDKSSLQRLSQSQAHKLTTYYHLNIPPVLFIEILADLKKHADDRARSEEEVYRQADKLWPVDTRVCAYWHQMAVGDMLGHPAPMYREQIPMMGGRRIVDRNGKVGVYFDEQPEHAALRRWRDKVFDDTESILAERWREAARTIDLESFRKHLRKAHVKDVKFKSLAEIAVFVDAALSAPEYQRYFMLWAAGECQVPSRLMPEIERRWQSEGRPALSAFSPYVYFILKAKFLFYLGLAHDFVTTRATNQIDLQYAFYLPFCAVFSTADKIQEGVCKALMQPTQSFVHADELKADLIRLAEWWDGLSAEAREEESYEYGSQPPDLPGSFTCSLWRSRFGPRKKGRGNRALRMTKEQNDKIIEMLRPQMEAIREDEQRREADEKARH